MANSSAAPTSPSTTAWPFVVGLAVDRAALDAAAGERARSRREAKWSRPRLALIAGVRPNSASVMTSVSSSSPRSFEVVEQRRHHVVEFGDHLLVRLEVLAVAVPPGAADADERHAGLDQPAGDERLLAELRRAVRVADLLRLLRDVEQLLARHQAADALVGLVVAAQRRSTCRPCANCLLSSSRSSARCVVVELGDRLGAADVLGDQCSWSAPSGRSASRGSRPSPGAKSRPSVGGVEGDVVGHLAVGLAQLAGEDRAEVGVAQARARRIRPRIISRAPPPWSPFLVFSERMMQVCFIRCAIFGISSEIWMPGHGGLDRPERPAGGGARLRVPGLELAGTRRPARAGCTRFCCFFSSPARAGCFEHVEHGHVGRERRRAGGHRAEEPAAVDRVVGRTAEGCRVVGLADIGTSPRSWLETSGVRSVSN